MAAVDIMLPGEPGPALAPHAAHGVDLAARGLFRRGTIRIRLTVAFLALAGALAALGLLGAWQVQQLAALAATHPEPEALQAAAATAQALMLAVTGAVVALAFGLCFPLTVAIVRPIRVAARIAARVASGDLTVKVRTGGSDEAAQLMAALAEMTSTLRNVLGHVVQGAHTVTQTSGHIVQGNLDLSQRTEEQASTLEQTASSIEQLTATVTQNAEHARQASKLAADAAAVARRGGDAVDEVVRTMDEISDASRRIGEIIGVIDGIAFQTNILALNAAVEAARAGEQGRGFAVVAGEVRSLAQRSAEAAKQIKGLISDSVERVQAGTQQVAEAGRAMSDIVAQVRRVNDLIAEISAATLEQTQGIGQVGDAVSQLDQVTQQNAALVEESAAAAESLSQQAARLVEAVGAFRLDGRA